MKFDYIVVGAGSAGCVMAARLSENPGANVLLLEAGPDYHASDMPPEMRSLNFRGIVMRGGHHWAGLEARYTSDQVPAPCLRGFGSGGSSAIHALTAIRGVPDDFDSWQPPGWSWEDVLPFFKRLETDHDFGGLPYHGSSGPVPIMRIPRDEWGHVGRAFVEGAIALGHPWCEDINEPGAYGAYAGPLTIRDRERFSASDAYLEPIRQRPNLSVIGDAPVDRVAFANGRVTGVHVNGTFYEGREVILCAGALHTPGVLLRSGIGAAEDLRSLGVSLIADLPAVGRNLCEDPLIRLKLKLRAGARAESMQALPNDTGMRTEDGITMFVSNIGPTLSDGGIGIALMEPRSRGRVRVTSTDPSAHPAVDFDLLSDPSDIVRLRGGVEEALRILEQSAFGGVLESIEAFALSDSELRTRCEGFFHASGTCRMGEVVDERGRVYGIDGLRVADASVMPSPPRAATYLTTLMIAERLAALM